MTSSSQPDADRSVDAFLQHVADGAFMLSCCQSCGAYSVPNAEQCETCGSTDLTWLSAAGTARLISWTYDSTSVGEEVPHTAVVIVEFREGPWWWGRLVLDGDAPLHVGAELSVAATTDPDGTTVPSFRLPPG